MELTVPAPISPAEISIENIASKLYPLTLKGARHLQKPENDPDLSGQRTQNKIRFKPPMGKTVF